MPLALDFTSFLSFTLYSTPLKMQTGYIGFLEDIWPVIFYFPPVFSHGH